VDIDEDSRKELLVVFSYIITCYKGRKKLWEVQVESETKPRELPKTEDEKLIEESASRIGDVISKILPVRYKDRQYIVSTSMNGAVFVIDAKSGGVVERQELGIYVADMVSEDVNNDGSDEIYLLTETGDLYELRKLKKLKRLFSLTSAEGEGLGIGDVLGSGKKEVIISTSDGRLIILDTRGKKIYEEFVSRAPIKFLKIADINNDGVAEIVYGTDHGEIALFFAKNNDFKTIHKFENEIVTLSITDINNDSSDEILACDYYGESLLFYPQSNEKKIIKSSRSFERDIDNDNHAETIEIYSKSIVVKKKESTIRKFDSHRWISTATLLDINDDGMKEILVGSFDKSIWVYSIKERDPIYRIPFTGVPLSIIPDDYDGDGKTELLVFTTDGVVEVKLT